MLLGRLQDYAQTNKIAVYCGEKALSYKDLYERSQALAWCLINNYHSDKPIGIFGDKQNDIIVGMFAAIYARKPYVILCETYPIDRLNYILEDCDADIILNVTDSLCPFNRTAIDSNDVTKYVDIYHDDKLLDCKDIKHEKLAAIIYTSGSTGNPKGVEITYGNLISIVNEDIEVFLDYIRKYEAKNKIYSAACMTSYAFSMSLRLFFLLGEVGAIWYSIPTHIVINTDKLVNYLIEKNPCYFSTTPSLIKRLLANKNFNPEYLDELIYITFGGEALEKDVAIDILNRFPNIYYANSYGSTETASSGIWHVISKELIEKYKKYIPIGDESSSNYLIMDESGNAIYKDGIIGEMVIFGNLVTKGYHGLDDLTRERFIVLSDNTRAFKTGDLAYQQNGLIYLVGRKDNQIKIGGNRIEIEDVEYHLNKCDIIQESAVGIKEKDNSLVGYIVLKEDVDCSDKLSLFIKIKAEMAKMVEPYKIPQKFVFMEKIPKNNSDKIDRKEINRLANE